MVDFELAEMLHVIRRNGELVLCINGSRRELLYFPMDGLPSQIADAFDRGDVEIVKSQLIAAGHDFLYNEFVLGRVLSDAGPSA